MIDLPKSTYFNRRMPKELFYKNLNLSKTLKKTFINEIESITWLNKLSPATMNVNPGKQVIEIAVMEIVLKQKEISKSLLEVLDRETAHHTVFIIHYKEWGQIWACYKETSKNREGKFKVDTYYQTDWLPYDDLSLKVEGLNLDKVYENFLGQIAGERLAIKNGMELKDAVEKTKDLEKLEAAINRLETQINNEIQFNRQVKLMGEIRNLKEKIQMINNATEGINGKT